MMTAKLKSLAFGLVLALQNAPLAQAQTPGQALREAIAEGRQTGWEALPDPDVMLDPLSADLLLWTRLRDGEGDLSEYVDFLARHPDWPGNERVKIRGEEAIVAGTSPAAVIAYFQGYAPQTGEGATRLAEALIASGQPDRARDILIEAWKTQAISDDGHDLMMAGFANVLAPYHWDRTDAMLWRWKTDDAARMLPLLDEPHRLLADARIALIRKSPDAEEKFAAVPAVMRPDTGLAYDRYNYLADKGDRDGAVAILLSRSDSARSLAQPFRWSGWRRSLARFQMREGNPVQAYAVASRHFLTPEDGENYADLEWLSGYIALRYLNDPALALRHFQTVDAAVDSPISAGRAKYWIARAQEALGQPDAALAAYRQAAQFQTGFYGLLAAEKIGIPLDPSLAGGQDLGDWRGAPFLTEEITRAAFALLDAGERSSAVLFFARLGQSLQADELPLLGAELRDKGEVFYELLIAKAALERGILIPEMYYPLHPLARKDIPVPTALALSIARRESEFREDAGSPVGALGLMQLMPATAEEVATELGLPYSRWRLTSDWDYNATLGSQYLSDLAVQFGYTPPMIAAGYNAGPSRPEEWIDTFGDPRLDEIDIVDWIEHIPFRETRNYVQRVTETIPIYEARLTGQTGPIRFTEMLKGAKPLLRPVARPEGLGVVQEATSETAVSSVPVDAVAGEPAPQSLAPVTSLRPVPRAGR